MARIRSVGVLFHERQPRESLDGYQIQQYAEIWREMGIRVEMVQGISRPVDTDLLFPQIDLSYIPDDYWEFLQRHPCVVNRKVRDIRKRAYCTHLARPGDGGTRPVIVKTNLNHAGMPERLILGGTAGLERPPGRTGSDHLAEDRPRRKGMSFLGLVASVMTGEYPIFNSVAEVPPQAFESPDLIVQYFMPERDGDQYILRQWTFLGDRWRCTRRASTEPLVKGRNSVRLDDIPVPQVVVDFRRRLGMDYGKIDFVLDGAEVVILDVNVTPTMSRNSNPGRKERWRAQAEGILYFENGG